MKSSQTLLKAFASAIAGLRYFFVHERNGRIQLLVSLCVLVASLVFRISAYQWIAVLFCIGSVLGLEMLNSAIEKLCDLVHESYHPVIKIIKDVSAAAVLLVCFVSVIAGIIIFLPRIIDLTT